MAALAICGTSPSSASSYTPLLSSTPQNRTFIHPKKLHYLSSSFNPSSLLSFSPLLRHNARLRARDSRPHIFLPHLVASMEQVEETYIMIKPDGVQRGLVGEIITRFEKKGFLLKGLKLFQCPAELAEEHYKDLKSKSFFPKLIDYITSGPVVCMAWEGIGVVASARKLIGATNPLQAEPGTIRGDLSVQTGRNVVHGSDSPENGQREIGVMDCDVVDERFMIKMAIVAVLAALGHYFCHYRLLENHHKYVFGKGGTNYIRKALSLDRELFRDVYRMYPEPFRKLCLIFKQKGLLKDTRYVTLEEQVAMTLIILAHGQRYSITRERFRRSVWTVSTYFNKVIDAILAIAKDYIKAPTNYLHPQISNDERFFPYFKDCIGALDGTHVPAHILGKDQMRFWNRKGHITQNLLIACNFDLEFTYVLAGWEGSTADASLLKTALTSPSKRLLLPEGKYMLVDAGFANIPGFLAPFRKTRYHLKEFGTTPDRLPQTAQELFNHRHSSLRNAIERSFAVWKNRFEICKRPPMFPYKTQVKIVAATCVLHNFLRRENKEDIWDNDSDDDDDDDDEGDIAPILPSNTSIVDGTAIMGRFRDKLVKKMWDDRKRHEL